MISDHVVLCLLERNVDFLFLCLHAEWIKRISFKLFSPIEVHLVK